MAPTRGGVPLQDQALTLFRDHIADVIFGTLFVFIGLAACAIAAMRRRSGVRLLFWLGLWSAMYGTRPLLDSLGLAGFLSHWFEVCVPYLETTITYMIVVVALLAFLELAAGGMRLFLQVVIVLGLAIALSGVGFFVLTGSEDKMIPYNNLLATCILFVLVIVIAVPSLSRKFFGMPDRGVLAFGTFVFAIEALYTNLARSFHYPVPPLPRILDSLAFAAFLLSFAYVAMQILFTGERRLLALESELAIAREIQTSILPHSLPKLSSVQIAAAYRPMTAAAGDFYEFIPLDQHRAGFLVADVTGHGVPAALIASMIKVAVQSVVPAAHDPREVLRSLNRILSGQLRDQFVTAAYLWLDTRNCKALYSAAGHPPLLLWRNGILERIESNGLLFGVVSDSDYPVREIPIYTGDRYLLYTDGIIEPENQKGDSFGDHKLEQVVRDNLSRPTAELVDRLLSEICRWRPPSIAQQDNLTLIVLDIL